MGCTRHRLSAFWKVWSGQHVLRRRKSTLRASVVVPAAATETSRSASHPFYLSRINMPRRYPTLRSFKAFHIWPNRGDLSDGDECCICFDPYDNNAHQPVGVTSNSECDHVFGRQCLESWLDSTCPNKNTCPVCRRKWYTRSSTGQPSPRDTNTSQVLALPALAAISRRDNSESRTLQRSPLRNLIHALDDVNVSQHVEQLLSNIEALEALERAGVPPIDRVTRTSLQQGEARIHSFLERNATTIQASTGTTVHRSQPRTGARGIMERAPRHQPEMTAELEPGEDPYSLLGIAIRSSTFSLPELPLARRRSSQQSALSSEDAGPTSNRSESPSSLRTTVRSQSSRVVSTNPLPLPNSRAGRRNAVPLQSSNQARTYRAINLPVAEEHLSTSEAHNSNSARDNGPLYDPHATLADIAEAEGSVSLPSFASPPAIQTMGRTIDNRRVVHDLSYGIEEDQIPLLRYRASSTPWFADDPQPIHTSTQPITTLAVVHRSTRHRSQAVAAYGPPRGHPRMIGITILRDLVTRNRSR
ncbi:hypothetical protein C7974DRAFT_397141 [Boeremia exigua]|uniref:uncharacterized protein n=1 Tax=Boeremia exigua TaxID=749465 RepID=UPI001E8DBFC5|nr:uncharacterized protein C7974DRAFT_397141 [Boeremia exigua]KAH6621787.1 hypothetical protein C7974DRAFT_397141 [Boeremia exigua]